MQKVNFDDFPRLGFGIMRVPTVGEDKNNIDIDAMTKLVDRYMASGMNYFDTAYVYYGGNSERALKESLVKRYDRESFYLADKMPFWGMKDESELEVKFNESLERCGVDYFDMYLLHCMEDNTYEAALKFNAFEFVKKLKTDGKAKRIGFSFHGNAALLKKIFENHPEMEFVQLQINYVDWDEQKAKEFYRLAMEYKKPIIIMEPVKGGTLANIPKDIDKLFKEARPDKSTASWAIRYVSSLPGVITTLSGMSNMEQIEDNLDTCLNFEPISEKEQKVIDLVVAKLIEAKLIPCTACRYCSDCPQSISIADQFSTYNEFAKLEISRSEAKAKIKDNKYGDAGSCVSCGACETHCPQNIKIIERLKLLAKEFKQ